MRRYFDDEERYEEEDRGRDTEVTLTPSAIAGVFFALLLLCGLCFGGGYWVGHRSPEPSQAAATQPPTPTAAPDEEPLQANSSVPKPSAEAQAPVPPPAQPADNSPAQPAPGSAAANPQPNLASPASEPAPPPSAPVSSPPAQPQAPVRPAFSSAPPPAYTSNIRPAAPEPGQLMVQIASVSHDEDAQVLVNALRKRGYSATAQRDSRDGMIHVRIGPFTSRQEADRMARRLLDDGYNAMVQP